jgi:hypothetical protein
MFFPFWLLSCMVCGQSLAKYSYEWSPFTPSYRILTVCTVPISRWRENMAHSLYRRTLKGLGFRQCLHKTLLILPFVMAPHHLGEARHLNGNKAFLNVCGLHQNQTRAWFCFIWALISVMLIAKWFTWPPLKHIQ